MDFRLGILSQSFGHQKQIPLTDFEKLEQSEHIQQTQEHGDSKYEMLVSRGSNSLTAMSKRFQIEEDIQAVIRLLA